MAKAEAPENQLLLLDQNLNPITEVPEPIPVDRRLVDPNPGPNTPIVEGWSVMNRAIHDIARQRSNQGFLKLNAGSKPVREFARTVDETPQDTQELVRGTVERSYDPRKMTYAERAGYRLIDLHTKQNKKAQDYASTTRSRLADSETISETMRSFDPMKPREVEERFFGTQTKTDKQQTARRRQIGAFVKRGGWPKR